MEINNEHKAQNFEIVIFGKIKFYFVLHQQGGDILEIK